jgi:putative endonuclease
MFCIINRHMKENFYVYVLASQRRGTLYIGVTSDLIKRVYEHKNGLVDGFTKKYEVHRPVCYEVAGDAETALSRERQMKKWNRIWKISLIEENNPEWADLYDSLTIRKKWIPACAGMTNKGNKNWGIHMKVIVDRTFQKRYI